MRTLCLKFSTDIDRSLCDAFVSLSPRVQWRSPNLIFIDIASTSHLLGGEGAVLKAALTTAAALVSSETLEQSFAKNLCQGAIADAPTTAQALASFQPGSISPPQQDVESLGRLPLEAFYDLEGLSPWPQKKVFGHIISFFHTLGIFTIADVQRFRLASLRERWGSTGELLAKRIFGHETQAISVHVPRDPLYAYIYFEHSQSNVDLLMADIGHQLNALFARLQGLSRFAQKLVMTLHCEYSKKQYNIEVEPVSPSRDLFLFSDLLKSKLATIELDNPIREVEIELLDVAEKTQQLDFFQAQESSEDRWRRLLSFAKQNSCEIGFLQRQAKILPENSFEFVTEKPQPLSSHEKKSQLGSALQVKRAWSKEIKQAPRPSLLLENPEAIDEPQKLQFLSRLPTERIEVGWWSLNEKETAHRDYYFALSENGQLLWLFRDRMSDKYYLHGYFD